MPSARRHHEAHEGAERGTDSYPDDGLDGALAIGPLAYSGNRGCSGARADRRPDQRVSPRM